MENFKKDQNSRWPLIWPFAERLKDKRQKSDADEEKRNLFVVLEHFCVKVELKEEKAWIFKSIFASQGQTTQS